MATIVTDPFTELSTAIENAVLDEFDDELYLSFQYDRLHESLGSDGRLYVAVSPETEPADNIELRVEATLQFYDHYNLEIDPRQAVDPRMITNKAERMRRALSEIRTTGTPYLWFFDVVNTRYPNDPTGNKTRFEMTIVARGGNAGLLETIG